MEANQPLAEGAAFRAFENLTLLRQDDNGYLYLARHAPLDRNLLVRILPKREEALIPPFLERIRRLSEINHPHVARIYDFGREGDLVFFSMDGGPPPSPTLANVRDAARGLAALHASDLEHGALGPQAIVAEANASAYLTDFGIEPKGRTTDLERLADLFRSVGAPESAAVAPEGAARAAEEADRRLERPRGTRIGSLVVGIVAILAVALIALLLSSNGSPDDGNLLSRFDPTRDIVYGKWSLEEGVLRCRDTQPNMRIQIPADVPLEYDLVLDGLRLFPPPDPALPGEIWIGLLMEGRQVAVRLNGRPRSGFKSGIGSIDGKIAYENETTLTGRILFEDRAHAVICSVRRDSLKVRLDGKTILEWKGDASRLGLHAGSWMPRKDVLFFGVSRAECRLDSIRLLPPSAEEGPESP